MRELSLQLLQRQMTWQKMNFMDESWESPTTFNCLKHTLLPLHGDCDLWYGPRNMNINLSKRIIWSGGNLHGCQSLRPHRLKRKGLYISWMDLYNYKYHCSSLWKSLLVYPPNSIIFIPCISNRIYCKSWKLARIKNTLRNWRILGMIGWTQILTRNSRYYGDEEGSNKRRLLQWVGRMLICT